MAILGVGRGLVIQLRSVLRGLRAQILHAVGMRTGSRWTIMSAPIPGTLSAVIRHGKTRYRLRAFDVNDEESGEVSRDGPSVPCWVLQGTLALT